MAEEIAGADFYHNAKPLAQAYALAEIERLNLAREVQELKAQLEQARREEMEACCRDVCPYCAEGLSIREIPSEMFPDRTVYVHEDPECDWFHQCLANLIRQRWQQGQGQGQKKGAGE